MTATHETVRSLARRVEGVGHKLYMNNLFSSSAIFDDLYTRGINYCGTVRQNNKGMPWGLNKKTLKLKQGDIYTRVRGNRKDRQDIHILTNMPRPLIEGNFCDKQGKAQKPVTVTGYVDKGDRNRKCCLALVQNVLEMSAREPHPQSIPRGTPFHKPVK
jgi:hypothetical protein